MSLLLVPLFASMVQLGLSMYVRNTLAACAQEGARYGSDENFVAAGADTTVAAAVSRTTSCIESSLPNSYAKSVEATVGMKTVDELGQVPVVEVTVASGVPVFGMLAPVGAIHVTGDALQEQP